MTAEFTEPEIRHLLIWAADPDVDDGFYLPDSYNAGNWVDWVETHYSISTKFFAAGYAVVNKEYKHTTGVRFLPAYVLNEKGAEFLRDMARLWNI